MVMSAGTGLIILARHNNRYLDLVFAHGQAYWDFDGDISPTHRWWLEHRIQEIATNRGFGDAGH